VCEEVIQIAVKQFDRLDILVLNAAEQVSETVPSMHLSKLFTHKLN
jgi:NADP-dependent 3-hydroxy acid dehydrogenase YdfG